MKINIIIAILLSAAFLLIPMSDVVKAETRTKPFSFDAEFSAQEIQSDITNTQNLADPDNLTLEIEKWEEDWGVDFANASYNGALLEPSVFELDYAPEIQNDYFFEQYEYFDFDDKTNYTTNARAEVPLKRSSIIISSLVKFSNREIMNGATETWVKIPILKESIDISMFQPTLSIYLMDIINLINNNSDNILNLTIDTKAYNPTRYAELGSAGDRFNVYDMNEMNNDNYILPINENNNASIEQIDPEYFVPYSQMHIKNNIMYAPIYYPILPNINYSFVFTAMLLDKPKILITEDDICSNGIHSNVTYVDANFVSRIESRASIINLLYQTDNSIYKRKFLNTTYDNIASTHNIELPIDLAFSFIFKEGIGANQMFGHKFHFNKGDAISFYNNIQFTQDNKYISVMLPFITNESLEINITADIRNGAGELVSFEPYYGEIYAITKAANIMRDPENTTLWGTTSHENYLPRIWQSPDTIEYKDFMLFTIPYQIRDIFYNFDADAKITIIFERECNVTFMFTASHEMKDLIKIPYGYANMQEAGNLSFLRYVNPDYLYVSNLTERRITQSFNYNVSIEAFNFALYNLTYGKFPINQSFYGYKLFRSVQTTKGLWSERYLSDTGDVISTHFYERRVALAEKRLFVETSTSINTGVIGYLNDISNYGNNIWNDISNLDLKNLIYSVAQFIIAGVWEGIELLIGSITSAFNAVKDKLVKIGNFIVSNIMEFFGKIWTIIEDIYAGAVQILEVFIYLLAVIVFMYILGNVSKFIYLTKMKG